LFYNNIDLDGNRRGYDAWVVKYSSAGAVEWKKSYGGSMEDGAKSIINTTDGGYLFVGYTHSNDGDILADGNNSLYNSDVWVVKINNAGVIQWQKTFGGAAPDQANALSATADGGFVFAGVTQSTDGDVSGLHSSQADAWVVRLTATGNILWQRCLGGARGDAANSIQTTVDGGCVLAGQTESNDGDASGHHGMADMWVVKLTSTGTLQWQRSLGGTQHDIGNSIAIAPNGGYIVCGETSSANGDVSFNHSGAGNVGDIWVVKLTDQGATEWEKSLGGTDFDVGYSITPVANNGYVLTGMVYSNNGDVSGNHSNVRDAWIVKLTNAGAMEWQKCIGGELDEIPRSIIAIADGEFVLTGYTNSITGDVSDNLENGGYQTWTVKLGACEPVTLVTHPVDQFTVLGRSATFKVSVKGSAPFSYQWYRNGTLIPNATGPSYTVPVRSLSQSGDEYYCIVINCSNAGSVTTSKAVLNVTVPPTCEEEYFFKTYANVDSSAGITDMVLTSDNELILVGGISNSSIYDGYDAFIFRADKNGNKRWELTLSGPAQQYIYKIIKTNDHNYLALGQDDGRFFLLKLDGDGNTIWRQKLYATMPANNPVAHYIKEAADGSFYMAAFYSEIPFAGMLFTKCDNMGNLVYSNHFQVPDVRYRWGMNDLVIKDGYTYIAGYHTYERTTSDQGFLSKIENSSGNLLWTKTYNYNNSTNSFLKIFDYSPSQLCILGERSINGDDMNSLFMCDTSGAVQHVSYFQFGSYRQFGNASLDPSGNILYANYHTNDATRFDLAICLVNPYTGIQWAKRYPDILPLPRVSKILMDANNDIYCAGQIHPRRQHLFLGKFNHLGENGCTAEDLPVQFGTATSSFDDYKLKQVAKSFNTVAAPAPVFTNVINLEGTMCTVKNNCNVLKTEVIGRDTICMVGDTVSVRITKNVDCYTSPLFTYDKNSVSFLRYRAGIALFTVKTPGSIAIVTQLNACDTLTDTVSVFVSGSSTTLNLGNDTSLCSGEAIVLHPGAFFNSYQWQDGSTDSLYQVAKQGKYYVVATDACGNRFSDTIVVSLSPEIPVSAGPDRWKCNNDTLQLKAADGFVNYSWSNTVDAITVSGQYIVVNPSSDVTYFIKAQKQDGCFAFDTLAVNVKYSSPIFLGNDTSFCQGDSLSLHAGAGFVSYKWNTGSVSPQIHVHVAGSYILSATNAEGCSSVDSIKIIKVHNEPDLTLNKNSVLCAGENRVLDAGNHESFLWNDGTTTRTLTIKNTGVYAVEVTDINGCRNSDTAVITRIAAPPQKFLPADTSICLYQSLIVKTNTTFRQYRWSNNSTASFQEITQPGTYWVTVTDNNQCTGTDTIQVKNLNCRKGIYFPTAFSPGNDGKNDKFKPVVSGVLVNYHFTIYNRWGEKVFESTNYTEGWNGSYIGKIQDGNGFVWTCTYQFNGETLQREKGTVILVR
jgi:gliding motility-associated-like protein